MASCRLTVDQHDPVLDKSIWTGPVVDLCKGQSILSKVKVSIYSRASGLEITHVSGLSSIGPGGLVVGLDVETIAPASPIVRGIAAIMASARGDVGSGVPCIDLVEFRFSGNIPGLDQVQQAVLGSTEYTAGGKYASHEGDGTE